MPLVLNMVGGGGVWRSAELCACSTVSDSLRPHGLYPARLLHPRDFPDKNTGVGCHFLLQEIFLTQGSNTHLLHLLHWQAGSLPVSYLGSLVIVKGN